MNPIPGDIFSVPCLFCMVDLQVSSISLSGATLMSLGTPSPIKYHLKSTGLDLDLFILGPIHLSMCLFVCVYIYIYDVGYVYLI